MLEEQHRIVAADRRAQQTRRVLRVRRIRDAEAGAVREDALARLAVVRCAAAQVAADRHANDHRAREVVARSVPHHRHLVAQLHHRRPDVVEELDLDDRLDAARRHADRAADDVGLGERRVEHAVVAEHPLQAVRHLEDAALALDERQRRLPARVGDVLAEDDDARVALISSFSVRLIASTIVSGLPSGCAGVSNAADVGSTSGEYSHIVAVDLRRLLGRQRRRRRPR